jgi:hypothetical protein
MIHKFFYKPTQVLFVNPDVQKWTDGIGYNDEIIDLSTGKIYKLFHLYQFVNNSNVQEPFYKYDKWTDLTWEGWETDGGLTNYPEAFVEANEPGVCFNHETYKGPIKVYH